MEKYFAEISKLAIYLKLANIPFTFRPLFSGFQIVPDDGGWDIVCHEYSYGGNDGLLEGYKGNFVTDDDEVTGYLTAEKAFALIVK